MFLAQGGPESLQSVEPAVVVLGIVVVLFWRVFLKILLIAVIVLVVSGFIFLVQDMHHVVR